jgi:hypothetical protein
MRVYKIRLKPRFVMREGASFYIERPIFRLTYTAERQAANSPLSASGLF